MSLFMDVHNIEGGVSAADVAGAHQRDLETQGDYGVSYLRYWVDESAGKIFCLVEAGSAEDAATVHPSSLVTATNPPPSLFGYEFHPHSFLPVHILHVWVWKDNPSGMFEDFNPKVGACPS
jgi:hypothetical protein